MTAALGVDNQNIENWWETAKKAITKIKSVFQGEDIASFHFNKNAIHSF
jgi:hypothetical protein